MKIHLRCFLFMQVIMIILTGASFAQKGNKSKKTIPRDDTSSTGYWRKKGYEAKMQGARETALVFYKKVLLLDSTDYDAKLAIANLYYSMFNNEEALFYYRKIYKNDPKDVEALYGMGRCYLRQGNTDQSIYYLKQAIIYLPNNIPPYSDLALAYINAGELENAKKTYLEILEKDSGNVEAWAGAGRIFYWQDKPWSALYYLKKAFSLDVTNKKIKEEYAEIANILKYQAYLSFYNVREIEDPRVTTTHTLKPGISKRISNSFNLAVNAVLEGSRKTFKNIDTSRNFNNIFIRVTFIRASQNLSAFAGASPSDSRFTSLGGSWGTVFALSKIKIRNTLLGSYEYFYYWNQVGRDFYSDNLNISYSGFSLEGDYKHGAVRYNYIWDYYSKDKNPFDFYSFGFKYKFLKNPAITVGVQQRYTNYAFRSPLYYSPYQRVIRGFSISPYYHYKKFYTYMGYSRGFDNYKNKIWAAELEAGYSLQNLSFAVGGSRYVDPYYTNKVLFISVRDQF